MKKIQNGLLVILEGGEGVGKTTQAKKLVEHYTDRGYAAKYFREPGGNELAEKIRNLALYNEMDSTTETLLMCAARNINIQENVLPALVDGNIVILDRFTKSTLVYQGILKDGDLDLIELCNHKLCKDLYSNDSYQTEITLLCDAEAAIERAAAEGHERNKNDVLPVEDYKKINDSYIESSINPKYKRFESNNCLYHILDTTKITESEVFERLVGFINPIVYEAKPYEE